MHSNPVQSPQPPQQTSFSEGLPSIGPWDGLHPNKLPISSMHVDRELPEVARTWGRIVDTTKLLPGDLILTRDTKPDDISEAISAAQEKGGFPKRHAQWTHAAIYLGDGEHICEANFKVPNIPWGVRMRSIYNYCDGNTALRARRPKVHDDQQRIRIAIGAMTSLGKGYSFSQIYSFAKAAYSGRGFWQNGETRQRISRKPLVCSTLYQDAYNFSYQGVTVRMGTMCTPAHLSASPDFETDDPEIGWLEIV